MPDGLVVRILGFHCHGLGSIPGGGTGIPQALCCAQNKKKDKRKEGKKKRKKPRTVEVLWREQSGYIKDCSICQLCPVLNSKDDRI